MGLHFARDRSLSECAAYVLGDAICDLVEPTCIAGLEFIAQRLSLAERERKDTGVSYARKSVTV